MLCSANTDAGDVAQPLDCILMRYQGLCQTSIDFGHVSFDQVYLLQVQFQDDTLRLGQLTAQRISELLFAGMQPPVAQSR